MVRHRVPTERQIRRSCFCLEGLMSPGDEDTHLTVLVPNVITSFMLTPPVSP